MDDVIVDEAADEGNMLALNDVIWTADEFKKETPVGVTVAGTCAADGAETMLWVWLVSSKNGQHNIYMSRKGVP